EAVGEPAGPRTGIEAPQAPGVEGEVIECAGELHAPPRDVRARGAEDVDPAGSCHQAGGLKGRGSVDEDALLRDESLRLVLPRRQAPVHELAVEPAARLRHQRRAGPVLVGPAPPAPSVASVAWSSASSRRTVSARAAARSSRGRALSRSSSEPGSMAEDSPSTVMPRR